LDYYDLVADGMRRCDDRQVEQVPWRRIAAFVESIEAERTPEGLAHRVLESLESVMPFDRAFIIETGARVPEGARFHNHPKMFAPLVREYAEHYRHHDPMLRALQRTHLGFVDWTRFAEDEFSRDFIARTGASAGFAMSNSCERSKASFTLIVGRMGGNDFTDLEKLTAAALFPHLSNLFAGAMDPFGARGQQLEVAFQAAEFTQREREVALLLCQGFAVSEIADSLFVSRKTAAKHLEHVYDKLGVRGKRQARSLLLYRTILQDAGAPAHSCVNG
jgi:DNA-binding CsgD family transcriptional regulator